MTVDSTTRNYGTLVECGRLKGNDLREQFSSPDGRYVSLRRGHTLTVVDTKPAAPTAINEHARIFVPNTLIAIHPDGQSVAVRNQRDASLVVRTPKKVLRSLQTATSLLAFDGTPLEPGAPKPRWGYAHEHLHYSPDGAHLFLATHDEHGAATVLLYDALTLDVVDQLSDLRSYSPYAIFAHHPPPLSKAPKFVPMSVWSECTLGFDRYDPSVMLGICNAGDSCDSVHAFRVKGGRIGQLDPAPLSNVVFAVDAYALYGLCRLPGDGLLVVDSNHHMARLSWPPEPGKPPLATGSIAGHLRDENDEIKLPFYVPAGQDLFESAAHTVTERHLLMNIEASGSGTQALVAFDPHTLKPLGLVRRPRTRGRFGELQHLGGDLFAGVGSSAGFFRLKLD